MGVAKSLRKAGHLQQLGQGLNDIGALMEENRKKQEQKKFIEGVVGLYDRWKTGQEKAKQKDTVLKEGGQVTNVFSPDNLSPNQQKNIMGADKKPEMNLKVNLPENVQDNTETITRPPETQTRETTPQEQYSKAQDNLGEFIQEIAPMLMNMNVSPEQIDRTNVLTNLAKMQTESLKPKESSYFDLNQGQRKYEMDPKTGKIREVAYNPKEESTSSRTEKKDFKVSEDGFYMYWDDMAGNGKGDWVKTSQKAPKDKGDGQSSVGWARLFYEMEKDKEEGSNKKKETQGKYNSIMGSTFVPMEELVKQGLIKSDDKKAKDFGGAYIVRDDKNYQNYKLLYTDEELQDYAENQVPESPNKWGRQDPAGIKDKENDPLGIR